MNNLALLPVDKISIIVYWLDCQSLYSKTLEELKGKDQIFFYYYKEAIIMSMESVRCKFKEALVSNKNIEIECTEILLEMLLK